MAKAKKEEQKEVIKKPKKTVVKKTVVKKESKKQEKAISTTDNKKTVAESTDFKKVDSNVKRHTTFNIVEVITLMLGTMIICIMLGTIVGRGMVSKYNSDEQNLIDEVIKNYRIINDEYEVDDEKLLNNIIKGMLGTVDDPYASFIEKDSAFETELAGRFVGFGVQITTYNNEIVVLNVYENSSAAEQGLKVGDIITKVDDLDLVNKTNKEFTDYVKESSNKKFTVTVKRNEELINVVLEKRETIIPSVFSKIIENGNKKTGYIQVSIFSGTTFTQFKKQLEKLEKQNIDNLIIDLRNNSGGRADIVTSMVSLFMDSKHLVYQTSNKGEIEKFYSIGNKDKQYPIAVLINKDSASASEIMASALNEQLGSLLIGEKSYGKGTVQQVRTLSTGAEYKITTKLWLTSKGTSIDKKGLVPTHEVKLNKDFFENPSEENDNQLSKALEVLNK